MIEKIRRRGEDENKKAVDDGLFYFLCLMTYQSSWVI